MGCGSGQYPRSCAFCTSNAEKGHSTMASSGMSPSGSSNARARAAFATSSAEGPLLKMLKMVFRPRRSYSALPMLLKKGPTADLSFSAGTHLPSTRCSPVTGWKVVPRYTKRRKGRSTAFTRAAGASAASSGRTSDGSSLTSKDGARRRAGAGAGADADADAGAGAGMTGSGGALGREAPVRMMMLRVARPTRRDSTDSPSPISSRSFTRCTGRANVGAAAGAAGAGATGAGAAAAAGAASSPACSVACALSCALCAPWFTKLAVRSACTAVGTVGAASTCSPACRGSTDRALSGTCTTTFVMGARYPSIDTAVFSSDAPATSTTAVVDAPAAAASRVHMYDLNRGSSAAPRSPRIASTVSSTPACSAATGTAPTKSEHDSTSSCPAPVGVSAITLVTSSCVCAPDVRDVSRSLVSASNSRSYHDASFTTVIVMGAFSAVHPGPPDVRHHRRSSEARSRVHSAGCARPAAAAAASRSSHSGSASKPTRMDVRKLLHTANMDSCSARRAYRSR
mmetsp:Transcript_2663/g.7938  ORF Transcript_2663/g.7938 Transcript_2663/m.7938 type:complete len:512 (-) Transcript_2663:1021-2556(-)